MAVAAWRVRSDPGCRYIVHFWELVDGPDDVPTVTRSVCGAPFWPQYGRRLLGLPWPGSYRCVCDALDPGYCEFGMLRPGGLECHRYRLVGTRAVPREDESMVRASLQSLRTIGLPDTPESILPPGP